MARVTRSRDSTSSASGVRIPARRHAEDDLIDMYASRCAHDSYTGIPCFNVERSRRAAFCGLQVQYDIVNLRIKRCVQKPCLKLPRSEGTLRAKQYMSTANKIRFLQLNYNFWQEFLLFMTAYGIQHIPCSHSRTCAVCVGLASEGHDQHLCL